MNKLNYASLEASKGLHDTGIVLETEAVWWKWDDKWYLTKRSTWEQRHSSRPCIPAPSMAEVWRELPPGTGLRKAHSFTEAFNFTDTENADSIYPPCNSPDNPTDALIDLLIWVRTEAT